MQVDFLRILISTGEKLSILSELQTSRETEFIFQQAKHGPQSLQSIAKGIISSTIWKQSQLVLNSLCKFCLLKVLVKLYFCVHLKSIKVSATVKGGDFVLPSPVHLFCPCFLSLQSHNCLGSESDGA